MGLTYKKVIQKIEVEHNHILQVYKYSRVLLISQRLSSVARVDYTHAGNKEGLFQENQIVLTLGAIYVGILDLSCW